MARNAENPRPIEGYLPDSLPIIGVAGQLGSGKGEVSKVLEERFNFITRPVSDAIRDYAHKHKIPLKSRTDYWRTNSEIIERFGEDYLLDATLEKIGGLYVASNDPVLGASIDGLRIVSNAQRLKSMEGALLLGITADRDLRLQRALERPNRPEDKDIEKQFKKVERDEGAPIDEILKAADIIIPNEGTPEDLRESVLEIIADTYDLIPIDD